MAQIKLTKNSLRDEQHRLDQLQKYLPTLQLKKAMLQLEVTEARTEFKTIERQKEVKKEQIRKFSSLFTLPSRFDILDFAKVKEVHSSIENIAGVEFRAFKGLELEKIEAFLFDMPVWFPQAKKIVEDLVEISEKSKFVEEKKKALEKELRNVSIRVNLFDKVLIPRAIANIKKIKIFLQDQYLAAVAQAKVAKEKILKKVSV